jgi:5-oxoprolinase (ATP-hydrolysing)
VSGGDRPRPKPESVRSTPPPRLAAPALADEPPARGAWTVSIDRGGTFTDVVLHGSDGRLVTLKVPTDPSDATGDAAVDAIRRVVGAAAGAPIPAALVREVRIGTTAATNALLTRRGEPCALLVTKGFADLLAIGTQERPSLFALKVERTPPLTDLVVEIDERVLADGTERKPLDAGEVRRVAQELRERGVRSVAVVFLHAYAFPAHEAAAGAALRDAGIASVFLSHETAREIQAVPRGETTVADAYLTPVLRRSLARFAASFDTRAALKLIRSDGGLGPAAAAHGPAAVLSGPAGGALGVARIAASLGLPAAIGFDMGGTSTDVCRVAPEPDFRYETKVAGLRLRVPSLRVHTVAAGGGSILSFDGRRLRVGPESAGSHPGPAGYGRGGPPTITDANAVLGRLVVSEFPACFGEDGAQPFDVAASRRAIEPLAEAAGLCVEEIAAGVEEMAAGFVRVGDELVAQAIREESVLRGYDVRTHALVAFGGAGPQHACAVARALGVTKVVVPRLASVLSAWGIAGTREAQEFVTPILGPFDQHALVSAVADAIFPAGAQRRHSTSVRATLEVRTRGADATLLVGFLPPMHADALLAAFADAHRRAYGFAPDASAEIEVVNLRVRVETGARAEPMQPWAAPLSERAPGRPPAHVWTGPDPGVLGFRSTVVHSCDRLHPGDAIDGPALAVDRSTTIYVAPGWRMTAREDAFVLDATGVAPQERPGTARDPVTLTLFANRFMSIAERMGAVLERTSHSTNIKERLDFSCAVFDGEGRLVANAPHIPVHLGAMGESVRAVAASRGLDLREGDVILTNDPYKGGSHLPDVTAVTPVLVEGGRPRFWVANRAHHADIGGATPGSMPPLSTSIADEGACVHDLLIVRDGEFRESGVGAAFASSRAVKERVADLRAQAAANAEGARLLREACDESGAEVVAAYMGHVLDDGAAAMEEMLRTLPPGPHTMEDALDDGTPLSVSIEVRDGRAIVDFAGTGPRSRGNLNAPRAVTRAAVLYALRCLIGREIPLNEGCLRPVEIRIPEGSLLDPAPPDAVVGGNVETSMRIVDLVLGALGACAASQGTMNNVTFGTKDRAYYETLGGGGGAGSAFDGASAIQLHMTNTRITDVEVLETRQPVVLRRFAIRRGSGGAGAHRGGDGLVREYEFLAPMEGGVLSERRARGAPGLAGGAAGAPGRNVLLRPDGATELPGRAAFEVRPGDVLRVETPGGGGFGPAS